MTVPAYERQPSQMEFITKAKDLLAYTVKKCSKIPKKYTFYGVAETYKLAQTIVDTLIRANNVKLQEFPQKRKELFVDALGWLACMADRLSLLKTYVVLTDKQWIKWATLISITESLVKGVMASDKKRLGVQL